jgi:hypothetical protein
MDAKFLAKTFAVGQRPETIKRGRARLQINRARL